MKKTLEEKTSGPIVKDWTVMVYLAGDNNLSEDMITTLKSLKRVAVHNDGTKVNILAFYDSVYPTVKSQFYDFNNKPTTPATIKTNVFDFDSPPSDDISVGSFEHSTAMQIVNFVGWSALEHPAKNYCLILSGHGDAFRGRTLMYDENPVGGLTIENLRNVLKDAKNSLGPGKNFDVLGFDNCVMNLLEIGFEFRNYADYFLSSEGFFQNQVGSMKSL